MPVYAPPQPSLARQPIFGVKTSSRRDVTVPKAGATYTLCSGRDAVLAQAAMLEDLAERCGQSGAMHGLDYLIEHDYSARKTPHLICFFAMAGDRRPYGAAILFEYRFGPWRTGFYSTGDSFGVRSIIGPASLRAQIAKKACAALLQRGAGMVLASFKVEPTDKQEAKPAVATGALEQDQPAWLWASQTRSVQDHLPLADTVDATLARLGKRTRTHLRYYRRRLRETVPCDFLADVASLIDVQDTAHLERLNRSSLEPVAQEIFNLQYRSAVLSPDGFVSGLRSKDGQWLALVGGWRQGGTTWVQWQTNTAAFPSLSLGTAVRLFLIEQEVGRGTRKLAFHGGTSHSMGHAFPLERVVDLIARRGWLAALLVRTVPVISGLLPVLARRGNFLADVIKDSSLRWSAKVH